jgi:hypothetical protein
MKERARRSTKAAECFIDHQQIPEQLGSSLTTHILKQTAEIIYRTTAIRVSCSARNN